MGPLVRASNKQIHVSQPLRGPEDRTTMKNLPKIILLGILVICQSCATSKLWEDTNPNERVWIDANRISEETLKKRGIEYEPLSAEWGSGYLIEKSGWGKMKDYQLRMLGTPVTLVVDAATTVVVVGAYIFVSDPVGTCVVIEKLCN
jgi:hypothetical protein